MKCNGLFMGLVGLLIAVSISTSAWSQGLKWGENTYRCQTYRVVDGDTAYFYCELGFGITNDVKVRFEGIDAPEVRGSERPLGLESKKALSKMIGGKEIILMTRKTGKYGRWIGTVFLSEININLWMVRAGHAKKRE